jgi:sigma-B regulation protein RsbU (phosphoserine phosphatase)
MRALFNLARRTPPLPRNPVQAEVPQLKNANLAAIYYGHRMGGDFYDFVRVSPTRVLFGLMDVAGRLEENHDIVVAAQNTFRTVGAKLFEKDDINEAEAMIELCLQLNRTILKAAHAVRPCPAFAGCYNEKLGTVCYFNAGHTPGMVRDGGGIAHLDATGLPLGLFSHATCDASAVALEPGAALLLVSRGIVEAKCGGAEFGLESAKAVFERSTAVSAKDLCLSLLDHLQQFMCTPPTHNDVTALSLFRSPTMTLVEPQPTEVLS